jgi:hypothetical protein
MNLDKKTIAAIITTVLAAVAAILGYLFLGEPVVLPVPAPAIEVVAPPAVVPEPVVPPVAEPVVIVPAAPVK